MILLGIKDNGGILQEDAFGIDDNKWFTEEYYNDGNGNLDQDIQLYEIDPNTGELREIEGGGPFWNDDGRFVGVDWLWRDASMVRYLHTPIGNIFCIIFLVC